MPFDDPDFWIVESALQTAYWSTFVLLYLAAAAQLTFTAENRSTPLRIAMLVQQALLAGWIGYLVSSDASRNRHVRSHQSRTARLHHCLVDCIGFRRAAFMLGESDGTFARVKRRLPKSFLGRVFFTWFNPGPGTGYLFAVCNVHRRGVVGLLRLRCVLLAPWPR